MNLKFILHKRANRVPYANVGAIAIKIIGDIRVSACYPYAFDLEISKNNKMSLQAVHC
jgi:hypothetical protein